MHHLAVVALRSGAFYALTGSYRITVTVTDSRGASGAGSATLTVIL